jgi:double-stranded uracil-DNA glycosylase
MAETKEAQEVHRFVTRVLKRSFPPVVNSETRLLVLGSLPGEASLAQSRYYAHPRNQFWLLMSDVVDRDLTRLDYPDRLEALLAARVGLWDVVESASRHGSLDAQIRDHRPNRLVELAAALPKLIAIGFNGGTAARIGRKQLVSRNDLTLIDLPSSSPAFTMSLDEKRLRWRLLRERISAKT